MKKLLFLFHRPSAPVARHVIVVRSTSLRLAEWRRDPSLVRKAYELQQTALFAAMLAVLRNESPMNYALSFEASHDARIAHANQAAGYQLALNNIEAMAALVTPPARIESEFKPEFTAAPFPAETPLSAVSRLP